MKAKVEVKVGPLSLSTFALRLALDLTCEAGGMPETFLRRACDEHLVVKDFLRVRGRLSFGVLTRWLLCPSLSRGS